MTFCFRPSHFHVIRRPNVLRLPNLLRPFSHTYPLRQELPPESTSEESEYDNESYEEWLASEGQQWKYPNPIGYKWLGGNIPFPRNRTFKPPIPISDGLRTIIYESHMINSEANSVHTLATRYGIGIQRIEAIIRLKDLEGQWKKNKQLQTGFLHGMERLLGLHPGGHQTQIMDEIDPSTREDVNSADEVSRQATEEGQDRKTGISRTFFEPVDEDQSPVVPSSLDAVRNQAHASKTRRSEYPTKVVQPDPSRPAYKFVDVGLRWVDRADVEKRMKESLRRKVIKDRKANDRKTRMQMN